MFWHLLSPFDCFFLKGGQKGRKAKGRAGTQLNDDVDDED
jgi:hypothetical protein